MKERLGLLVTMAAMRASTLARQVGDFARGAFKFSREITHAVSSVIAKSTDPNSLRSNFVFRDWHIDMGPLIGKKGEHHVITFQPQCYFRVEKMIATDTSSKPGFGTRIGTILVGQRLQRPATGGGTLSVFFSNQTLGNGLRWDVCHPAYSIAMTIFFEEDCEFSASLFGKAYMGPCVEGDSIIKAMEAA